MKKTFSLSDSKLKAERVVDSIKFEIKKYLKRQRNKKLPEGMDVWQFNCRYGQSVADTDSLLVSDINKKIDFAVESGWEVFYIEIDSMAGNKKKHPKKEKVKETLPAQEEGFSKEI